MDHSIFLATYVAHLNRHEAPDRMRREEQYFLEQGADRGDLIRRLIVAVAIISISFSSLIVVAGYGAPELREQAVLHS